MRASTNSIYNNPPTPTSPASPPSVPLSVYRELAAELQTTQAQLDQLTGKNQQLTQENQLLRHEMTKLIQSCLRLQKLVDFSAPPPTMPNNPVSHTSGEEKTASPPIATAKPRPRQQVARPRPPVVSEVPGSKNHRSPVSVPVMEKMPQPVFIEEEEVRYYPSTEPETKEVSGWWLVITILLIMLTAFSAGYLVVRPLFEHQSR